MCFLLDFKLPYDAITQVESPLYYYNIYFTKDESMLYCIDKTDVFAFF